MKIDSFPDSFQSVRGATPEPIGQALATYASEVPAGQAIVELGVFCGRTALQLAYGASKGHKAHVWGIDAWDLPGNTYAPPFTDTRTRHTAFNNIAMQGYSGRITLINAFTHDIAATWTGPPVGLLFVDADHSAAGARRDVLTWLPHLAPGAVIALDDYHHPDWPGVAEAADQLVDHGVLKPLVIVHERLAVTSLAVSTLRPELTDPYQP